MYSCYVCSKYACISEKKVTLQKFHLVAHLRVWWSTKVSITLFSHWLCYKWGLNYTYFCHIVNFLNRVLDSGNDLQYDKCHFNAWNGMEVGLEIALIGLLSRLIWSRGYCHHVDICLSVCPSPLSVVCLSVYMIKFFILNFIQQVLVTQWSASGIWQICMMTTYWGELSCPNVFYCPWVGIWKNFNIGLYSANIGDSVFCFWDMTDIDDDYILKGHRHA